MNFLLLSQWHSSIFYEDLFCYRFSREISVKYVYDKNNFIILCTKKQAADQTLALYYLQTECC